MILTEEEARKKWCPMARVNDDSDKGYNRIVDSVDGLVIPKVARCIASDCAMWQRLGDPINPTSRRAGRADRWP